MHGRADKKHPRPDTKLHKLVKEGIPAAVVKEVERIKREACEAMSERFVAYVAGNERAVRSCSRTFPVARTTKRHPHPSFDRWRWVRTVLCFLVALVLTCREGRTRYVSGREDAITILHGVVVA